MFAGCVRKGFKWSTENGKYTGGKWKKGFQSCEQWSAEVWNIKGCFGHLARTLSSYQQVASLTFQLPEEARWRSRERPLFQCCLPSTGSRHGCSRARGSCHAGFHADTHRRERQLEPSSLQEWSPKPGDWRKMMSRASAVFVHRQLSPQNQPDENAETLRDMKAFLETLSKNVSKVFSLKKWCSIFKNFE